jgi:hypothetical protein
MRRILLLTVALCAAATSACKKDSSGGSDSHLTVTRSAYAAIANGDTSVLITVTGGTKAPITLTTSRGHWDNGEQTMTLYALDGDAYLRTCAAWETGCIGSAQVIARDAANVAGATSVLFTTNEICDNGVDDDQDQLTDCADTACPQSVRCNARGFVCGADKACSVCGGGGGTPEAREQSCDDGFDNDCDGAIDCADVDCTDRACSTSTVVGTCRSQACACDKTEQTEVSCSDGLDDDCDGKADCEDPNCLGKMCDLDRGLACGGVPVSCSVCKSGQATELPTQCGDGQDNDCDGKIDCEDSVDCAGSTCNAFGGVCDVQSSVAVCACESGKVAETNCADGLDDDCNGKIDCADPNCASQSCGPAATCEGVDCVDASTKFAVTVAPDRRRLPAMAAAQTPVRITVKFSGTLSVGTLLDVTTDASLGMLSVDGGTPASTVTVSTNAAGVATVNFIATGEVGIATITASPRGTTASGNSTIEMPALGQIKLASVQYPVMGVKSSGFQESNNIAVQLLDLEQKTYPAGLTVTFRHLTLGGSTLSVPLLADVPGECVAPSCISHNAVTDDEGIARLTLYSGTVAGTVPVYAVAGTFDEPARIFEVPPVAIIGAKASGSHFSVVCTPENIPALASTTCSTSLVNAPFTCLAVVKDRFNNILGRATMVTFMSEAGAVGQPATTPSYDPSAPPDKQGDLGTALEIINTLGNKLPKDVAPHQAVHPYGATPLASSDPRWEYARAYDDMLCDPNQVHNPRDGAATVITSTPGEEGFFDANGNGIYDLGEPFVDLPEPFVDYDDDNTRDPDEPFIDSNTDGEWNDVNGVWDGNTKIWTQTVVVYSGMMAVGTEPGTGQDLFSRWMSNLSDVATFPLPTGPATFSYHLDPLNGPDTTLVYVGATDGNFNWLAGESASADGAFYDIRDEWNVASFDGYRGVNSVPDTKGFSYVYWPCDAADLAKCANDCSSANVPMPRRCVMRSVLRGYRYGYTAPVQLGGSNLGAASWLWSIDLLGFNRSVPINGVVLP